MCVHGYCSEIANPKEYKFIFINKLMSDWQDTNIMYSINKKKEHSLIHSKLIKNYVQAVLKIHPRKQSRKILMQVIDMFI